ncbi:GTP-binding protein [Promicromonospora sp. NPDC052451]|uniref:GTP-binding protein n=1 Tax=unclassified Promicromonospora TaxID=2647929 RepID=UPI0037C7F59C
MTSQDATLSARTEDLGRALQIAGSRLDDTVFGKVASSVAGVRERLALGVDHTVVALAGGTGSGKSSTFNKISRLTFADVGVKRPTTAKVTACSWSDDATALLDWLGVERERRITRSGELDAADEAGLAGLVLLDLPDHDSVAPGHRDVVDKVLPLVDLLVWVVDPQKYADDALHTGYLRDSSGMQASTVVVLNQIDTVPVGQRDNLVNDVKRLLRDDGLDEVPVVAASTKTDIGIADLRGLLEQTVARRSVSAGRAAGELDAAAALLLGQTPAEVPWHIDTVLEREVDALSRAAGLESVAAQVGAAVRNGYGSPEFRAPDADATALSRSRWLIGSGEALKPGWQRSLAASVASAQDLASAVSTALQGITLDTRGPTTQRLTRRLALGSVLVAVLLGIATVLASMGFLPVGETWTTVLGVLAVAAAVAALVVFLVAMQIRRALAARREQGVIASGRAALERVLRQTLGEPTQKLLDEHRAVRELAQSARDEGPSAPLRLAQSATTGGRPGASSPGTVRLTDLGPVRA